MEAEPQYIENEYHIVRLSNDQVIHPQSLQLSSLY